MSWNPLRTPEEWRATIPWTNDEIIVAIEQEAESAPPFLRDRYLRGAAFIRSSGRISSALLSLALPRLVRTCSYADCGKPALYRYGNEGRCRAHKSCVPAFVIDKLKRLDAFHQKRDADIETERKQRDRAMKARLQAGRRHR